MNSKNALAGALLMTGALAAAGVASSGAAPEVAQPLASLSALETSAQVAPTSGLQSAYGLGSPQRYGVDLSEVRSLQTATGTWAVASSPSGVCVDFANGTVSCGSADDVSNGRYAVTSIDAPVGAEARKLAESRRAVAEGRADTSVEQAPAAALRRGLVIDGIASVRSVDRAGTVIAEAKVVRNTYELNLGLEGQAQSVEFIDAAGSVASRYSPW